MINGVESVNCNDHWQPQLPEISVYHVTDDISDHQLCSLGPSPASPPVLSVSALIYRVNLTLKKALYWSHISTEYTVLTTRVAWQALHGIMSSSSLSPVRSISDFTD